MKQLSKALRLLRDLARYRTHGGYTWAAITDDGELLCVPCVRENYRQVFTATRDRTDNGWRVLAISCNADSEESEFCAHCSRRIWDHPEA